MNTELERTEGTAADRVERAHSRHLIVPQVDIQDTPSAIIVYADMPGVHADSLDITLEKNTLTLVGRVHHEERHGWQLAFAEFGGADYRRVFTLSTEVDRDKISAALKDGVLELTLPKAEPARQKRITVNAG